MSYQVFARKWRPQTFSEVVGQEHVLTALVNSLSLGRIHHAYLLSGTRGVGKTSIARLIAKGLNCTSGITATPCGKCIHCQGIEQGHFIDLIEIDAASRTKVEDTRELLDNLPYSPTQGRFKVYLIDEVHMLSRHSFNALLKTLEEPPSHVKFLLATTEPKKLPVTIISRCLQFHLKALNALVILNQLEKILAAEKIDSDTEALKLLAKAASGSMRDALSLTDQAVAIGSGKVTTQIVREMLTILDDGQSLSIIEALAKADAEKIMFEIEQAAAVGKDWENLLIEMLNLFHRIAIKQLLPETSYKEYNEVEPEHIELGLSKLARTLAPEEIQFYYQTLLIGRKELPYAPNHRMGVEMTLLRALAFHPKKSFPDSKSESIKKNFFDSTENFSVPNLFKQTTENVADLNNKAPETPDIVEVLNTTKILKTRTKLLELQYAPTSKKKENLKNELSVPLEKLIVQSNSFIAKAKKKEIDDSNTRKFSEKELLSTQKVLSPVLEYEKSPELLSKLLEEVIKRDPWAAEVEQLGLPKLVHQLALNSFKKQTINHKIYLHLRSAQRHLNSDSAHKILTEALSHFYNNMVEIIIIEDDDELQLTPWELRKRIYEEMLTKACQSIIADDTIHTLCGLFDAELDKNSIRPI